MFSKNYRKIRISLSVLFVFSMVFSSAIPAGVIFADDVTDEVIDEKSDVCLNIEGEQEAVPDGYYKNDDDECFPIEDNNNEVIITSEVISNEVINHSCLLPDSLGDTKIEPVVHGWDDVSLQDIFNSEGINRNVISDQKQYQSWNASKSATTVNVEFISRNAVLDSVFGYYKNGDVSSFIPVFRSGPSVDFPDTPEFSYGHSATFDIVGPNDIGFAIKTSDLNTYTTLNSLNEGGNDHAVVYELDSNIYIVAFEDLALDSSDVDYNDVIVKVTVLNCQNNEIPTPPELIDINITASKIVCDSESDLPDWGTGGPDISASTTGEFLDSHPNCRLEQNWSFQWADSTTADPGKDFIGEASGWNTFGPTNQQGIATTSISLPSGTPFVWVREVLKDNYLPFSYPGDNNAYSAEMYCHIDVLNFDNFDRIDGPLSSGATYYCMAFNVSESIPPVNTPPTITLTGADPFNITIDDTFVDPGATANDTEDGDLTSAVTSTSTVNTTIVGTYEVVYSVTDSGGLSASTTRAVVVNPKTIPPVTPPSNGGGGGIGGHRHPIVVGEILGATSCLYLIDYLKIDWQNDPIEVLKLQSFLNVFEGENLSLTGVFNQATFEAVQRFQIKYSEDILEPWGDKVTTGFVYILTKKKINEIYCDSVFPISQAEQNEINEFRASGLGGESAISGGVGYLEDFDQSTFFGLEDTGGIDEKDTKPSIVELTATSGDDSVLKNIAVSLVALPGKVFGDSFEDCGYTPLLLLLILIAAVIIITKLFSNRGKNQGPDDNSGPAVLEEDTAHKDESPIIILPGFEEKEDEKKTPEVFPDEEIVIENPDEESEEIIKEDEESTTK